MTNIEEQSRENYIFPENEGGLFGYLPWREIVAYDIQVRDKSTDEPVPLCELDPILFRNIRLRSTTSMIECTTDPLNPLYGLAVEDSLLPEEAEIIEDEMQMNKSYKITQEQKDYLEITDKQLEALEPLVFITRDKEGKHTAHRDFPFLLWNGKAVNIGKKSTVKGIIS